MEPAGVTLLIGAMMLSIDSSSVPRVINVDSDPSIYYGELPEAAFHELLAACRDAPNFDAAVYQHAAARGQTYFIQYALGGNRALGLRALGSLEGKKILDYGCGVGSLAIPAAAAGAFVVGVDSCLPRLEFAALRANSHRVKDIQFLGCKSWQSLPDSFHGLFDHIVLNGILEWIPSTCGATCETALQTQLDFLRGISRFLAPGGTIFLAIENRFALQYLSGYPEDHTGIPFLSLVSRPKAQEMHRAAKSTDFVTLTWGLSEYHELLPSAGLSLKDGYGIFPDYRFPQSLVSLDDPDGLVEGMKLEENSFDEQLRDRMITCLREMGLLKHFVFSYILVLQKL
jgi:2-polyprenyl-3-methyl-5-hydroxy-6-metoxy-1,4-benzoquinol methylase